MPFSVTLLPLNLCVSLVISSQPALSSNLTISKILDFLKVAQTKVLPLADETIERIKNLYYSRDFEKLFFLLGDLVKFPVFLFLRKELDDIAYFRFLGESLTWECYAGEFPDFIRELLTERPLNFRQHLMSKPEQARLADLPEALTIYRGVHPGCKSGFSWTLSQDKALFFAKRHLALGRDAGVLRGTCEKKDAIAFFEREEEIFIDPKKVQKAGFIQLFARKSKMRSQTINYKYSAYLRIKQYLTLIGELPPSSKIRKSKQVTCPSLWLS